MDEYKLQFDNTAGWVVMRRSVEPAFKRDGTRNPVAGQVSWSPFKYPGKDLNRVAHTLINLSLDGAEVRSFEEWVNVYEAAADRVCEALKELVSK